jgi:hypothetical protein
MSGLHDSVINDTTAFSRCAVVLAPRQRGMRASEDIQAAFADGVNLAAFSLTNMNIL